MGKMLLACLLALLQPQEDTLRVMFWNLENFFDYRNDSTSVSDAEFSSLGERRWTKKRFQAKCNAIAKGILWAGSAEGGLPDVVGFAEVENALYSGVYCRGQRCGSWTMSTYILIRRIPAG